ncbi:MAG: O-antigen ligase family protein, partial [Desulfobulbaceae bacterium]|nr:O-antigen ligase family protein [Desulfobulbaceae bacterium]
EALRISSYVLFYILTIQLLSRQELLRKTVKIVAGLATAIALLAILQKFTSPNLIYWFRVAPESSSPVGPWLYRNHYAGFMELLFPIVLALFFYYRPRVNRKNSWRQKVVSTLSSHGSNQYFFLGLGAILIISSIFIGLSRGGIISATLALFFFLVLLSKKSSHRGKIAPLILVGTLLLAITWFGWDPIMERFNATTDASGAINEGRLLVWKDCLPYIKDFFVTGSGFGTFIHTFPQYSNQPPATIYDHAHNDYIELLTDGGLIGFVLAAWFVLTVIVHGWRKIALRRDLYAILLGIGALTGIVSILLHSVTDFNMHNGANGLYFFFLCGLLISAGNTRLHFRTRPTLLKPAGGHRKYLLPVAGLLLFSMVLLLHGGGFLAASSYDKISSIYLNRHLSEEKLQQVRRAVIKANTYDPLEGLYPATLGSVEYYLQQADRALFQYSSAARLDPMNGIYLQNIGLFLADTSPEQSKILLADAYARALHRDKLVLTWAGWLLQTGERQEAVAVMRKGAGDYLNLVSSYFSLFTGYSFSREEIADILPESTASWIRVGKFMEKRGDLIESGYYRSHALEYLDREKIIKPWYFGQLYGFYRRLNQEDKAIAVLRQAIERLPNYAPFHVYLGNYYKKEGIDYRAREEYEQALLLEPGNEKVGNKLKQLEYRGQGMLR